MLIIWIKLIKLKNKISFSEFFRSLIIFINMGRKKKYNTDEERLEAQRRWNMEYYARNKDSIKEKNLNRYHGKGNKDKEV